MTPRDTRMPEERELDERIERAKAIEARLDESLTRREVIEAIDAVAKEYSGSGWPEQDRIADAFRKLAEALT